MIRRSLVPVFLVFGLFVAAIAGAWGWFHVSPRRFPMSRHLVPNRQVTGYAFTNVPLEPEIVEMLAVATNEIVFGTFYPTAAGVRTGQSAGNRISVFFAEWAARSAREMSVVQHTPDVCWASAGALALPLGQPAQVELALGTGGLRFECRVFEFTDGARELSLWCTLVSGQILEEPARFVPSSVTDLVAAPGGDGRGAEIRKQSAGRRLAGGQFMNAVRRRIPGTGEKQFVRFSTPIAGNDWGRALAQLRSFAALWLSLEVTQHPEVAFEAPDPRDVRSLASRPVMGSPLFHGRDRRQCLW